MQNNYTKTIGKIKEEILSLTVDKNESDFVLGRDFMRFKFKTDDKLVYNKKVNVPICVISISSVFDERGWYYPQTELKECSYESDYLDKKEENPGFLVPLHQIR